MKAARSASMLPRKKSRMETNEARDPEGRDSRWNPGGGIARPVAMRGRPGDGAHASGSTRRLEPYRAAPRGGVPRIECGKPEGRQALRSRHGRCTLAAGLPVRRWQSLYVAYGADVGLA